MNRKKKSSKKAGKKVRFEHTGGAITENDKIKVMRTADVKMQDPIATLSMYDAEGYPTYSQEDTESQRGYMGNTYDIGYQEHQVPWDVLKPLFVGEDQILADLKSLTKEKQSIRDHHPSVRQVISQSLRPYPELHHEYLQS